MKKSKRPVWAVIAAALSILAVIVELSTNICTLLFDPLSDAWCVIAYCFLAIMMIANEYVLREAEAVPQNPSIARSLRYASAGTVVAIVIALVYTVLFIPALPYSIIALMFLGMGAGAWSPFLNLTVLLFQGKALREQMRFRGEAAAFPWRVAIGIGGVLLLAAVAIPWMPAPARHAAFQDMPGHRMFSTWWRFLHEGSDD